MRFDDRLLTLSSQPQTDSSAKAALWAQLVDLAAQSVGKLDAASQQALLERIDGLRATVPLERRIQVSGAVARRRAAATVVFALGRDHPAVASPILAKVELSAEQWLSVIPTLPIASRALLRERRDLPPVVVHMLSGFGSSDYALPAIAGLEGGAVAGTTAIGEMVARIEAFQKQRASAPIARPSPQPHEILKPQKFRFETDRDGVINWIDGIERGALIGLSISELASPGMFGVDGHAAGAFRQRAEFLDARLAVAGSGEASGNWLICGQPSFNADDGRFLGYRGIARRPFPTEQLDVRAVQGAEQRDVSDSMRQLAHELRTPLNAIAGFAQMIDQQYLGPAGHPYRQRARAILVDAAQLSSTIESADLSSQLDSGKISREPLASTDIVAILRALAAELEQVTEQRGVALTISLVPNLQNVSIAPENCQRMLARLFACVLDYAGDGKALAINATQGPLGIAVSIERPTLLRGLGDSAILHPGIVPDIEPLNQSGLGLAFSLRLVERLAAATGARLIGSEAQLSLILPPSQDSARQVEGG